MWAPQPIGCFVLGFVLLLQSVRVRLLSEAVSASDGAVNRVPRCPLCYIAQGFVPIAPSAHSYDLRSTRLQDGAPTTEAQRTTAAQESEPVPPRTLCPLPELPF